MPNWKKVIISGSDAQLNSLYVSSSLTASGNIYPTDLGVDRQVLKTDGEGNLTFGYPEEIVAIVKNVSGGTLQKGLPVHATSSGASGNVVGVIAASSSVADSMPATFILNETLANEAEGEALATGFIQGVNTSGFEVGQIVYVGANGGYTNVKPTGSNLIQNLGIVTKIDATNGSGYILGTGRSNDVPNVAPGNVLVGNSNSVPTAVLTSSLSVASAVSSTNATNATNATNIGVDSVGAEEVYLLMVENETGTQGAKTDGDLTYNSSTNALTATTFVGALSGNATTASSASHAVNSDSATTASYALSATSASYATNATNIGVDSVEAEEVYLLIVENETGTQGTKTDENLTYNSSTKALTATTFEGALSGNATTATSASHALTASYIGGIVNGIFTQTGSIYATTNDLEITGSLTLYKSGSTVFNIEGSQGNLFAVTDSLSGSLFSVNDISGIPILEVFSDDTVKIGTFNAEGITVQGSDVKITGSLAVGNISPNATDGRIDASNDIVAYSSSDKRWKTNIKLIESPLEKLQKLSGVEFDWIEDFRAHGNSGNDVGVIAQEVELVLPQAVQTRDTGMKAVRYEKIIPLLIETIKEQQKQIDELKNKIG